jgi:hypothetical protein
VGLVVAVAGCVVRRGGWKVGVLPFGLDLPFSFEPEIHCRAIRAPRIHPERVSPSANGVLTITHFLVLADAGDSTS